jgi:GNAT superfamily N-acetyltransferase
MGQQIEITAIATPNEIPSKTLRQRAERALSSLCRQFVARIDGRIIGCLSFDDRPVFGAGVIYEIFVLARFRRQGVASALLEFGENLATTAGYRRMRLLPRSLGGAMDDSQLVAWYQRRGYFLASNGGGEMEKSLAQCPQ